MKFTVLLISSFIIIHHANGQTNNYAPIGARWFYDANKDEYCLPGECDYTIVESMKDTIIDGTSCRKLDSKKILDNIVVVEKSFFIYEDSGRVFIYDECNVEFSKIYDFNLIKEDTLIIRNSPFCGFWPNVNDNPDFGCFETIVDSVDLVEISGFELKRYFVNPFFVSDSNCLDRWIFYGPEIIERIGNTNVNPFGNTSNMIPETGCCNEDLMCYIDDQISYSNLGFECDLITDIHSINAELSTLVKCTQTDNNLFISISQELINSKLELFKNDGSLVYSEIADQGLIYLDLASFQKGFYILTIKNLNYYENFKIIVL